MHGLGSDTDRFEVDVFTHLGLVEDTVTRRERLWGKTQARSRGEALDVTPLEATVLAKGLGATELSGVGPPLHRRRRDGEKRSHVPTGQKLVVHRSTLGVLSDAVKPMGVLGVSTRVGRQHH